MASALLAASRIEPSWGDRKVYMKNYNPKNTPLYDNNTNNHSLYPNPNPNPKSKQIHDSTTAHLHYRHDDDAAAAAIDEETASFVPRGAGGPNRFFAAAEYVTFHLGGLSRSELRELKKRLISELEQVRSLRTRLEAAVYESRSAYPSSQFSATARPSPESPRRKDEAIGSSNSKPKGSTQKKGSLGSKRVNPYVSDKREQLKKPALESHGLTDNNQAIASMMKKCASILSKLMKHKHGWVFNTPVDVVGLGLHDYRQIIKNPMDLGTVKSNLERDAYRSPREFASDVRLTFNNALTYNPKGHDVHVMAETLLQQFNQMFDPAYRKFEKERQKAAVAAAAVEFEESKSKPRPGRVEESVPQSSRRDPEAMSVEKKSKPSPKVRHPPALSNQEEVVPSRQVSDPIAAPAPASAPTPAPPAPGGKRVKTHKLPKPKAKDPNKREMSFEEKAKLGMNLQSLPPEKMGQLLNIIKKRNKHFAQDGDEIELDIEAVDTETLWELDRFVCNYKKLVSKIKRQGLINNQISASEITHKSLERDSPEPLPQKGKKGETGGGEEDVDIGDEMPASDYPPVEIERDARSDSSSSSSSSSDSSSSDSDSRSSSSGSDSDADSVQSPFVGSKGGHGS